MVTSFHILVKVARCENWDSQLFSEYRPRFECVSSQTQSYLVPDAVVSPPRRGRVSPRVRHQVWGLKRSCYCWFLFTAFKNDLGNGVSKESGSLVMG